MDTDYTDEEDEEEAKLDDTNSEGLVKMNSKECLVSHLPDEIVYADHARNMPYLVTMQGVLMFLDISGFTSLTEKYSMNAKNGIDQLTKTLNGYMRDLVSEILVCDGDILKFAGDAILTMWKVESFSAMRVTVGHVVKCAMNIQQKCGEYTTSVGVTLQVKIGISAGEIMVNYLGNEEFCHYVTMGRGVETVNAAEKFCVSGDIVISPTAWVHCSGFPIQIEVLDDGKHKKVTDYDSGALSQMISSYDKERTLTPTRSMASILGIPVDSKARKAVTDSYSKEESSFHRLYIAPPVLKKIDADQPLEYLSETRQVTVVFINLVLKETTKYEICQILQSAFQVIYEQVKKVQGLLNKVFMFDKGSTFLAIFGLPGFKHDNDCARALQCSQQIRYELENVSNILKTSIGVTTGPSYCGVVGHHHRHEYTVIGRKVNMAARLMMAYGGKVTCDNETYHHSKLQKANFTTLELKTMKGLQNIGTIREFKENKSRSHTIDALEQQEIEYPLIGRDREVATFMADLDTIKNDPKAAESCSVVVLNGPTGIGRTRLLETLIVRITQDKMRVVFCNLHMETAKSPYHAVKQLLMDLLEFDYDAPHQEREHALFQLFSDPFILENLSLLNDFLHLKLPQNERYAHMVGDTRNKIFCDLLFKMVHEISSQSGYVIFAVDDAQYMDPESWQFVEELGHDSHALVVLTLKSGSKFYQHDAAKQVLNNETTKDMHITGLESQYLASLACQVLGVVSIEEQLESILRHKSQGVPSWCEQLLYSMLHDEMLSIVPWFKINTSSHDMTTPKSQDSPKYLSVASQNPLLEKRRSSFQDGISELKGDSDVKVDMVCVLSPNISLEDVRIPESIKGMIQTRIDKMEEVEQMVIKSASVIGTVFTKRMLEALLPKNLTTSKLQESLANIAASNIFECGFRSVDSAHSGSFGVGQESSSRKYICQCPHLEESIGDTSINDCQLLRFKSASLQETAYEMYTEALRRNLHIKAARYLESQAHKCTTCGGGNFIPNARVSSVQKNQTARFRPKTADMSRGDNRSTKKASTLSKLRMSTLRKTTLSTPDIIVDTIQNAGPSSNQVNTHSTSTMAAFSKRSKVAPASLNTGDNDIGNFDEMIRTRIRPSICEEIDAADLPLAIDVRECKCTEVLMTVLPQLVKHWQSSGNVEKTVHFLMESGAAAIATDDNMQALAHLREVSHLIDCTKTGEDPLEGEISQSEKFSYNTYTDARNESLIGQALYHLGLLDESIPHFHNALEILGCVQPITKRGIFLKMIKEGFQQWKHHKFPARYIGSADPLLSSYLIEQARCLSHIYNDYQRSHYDRRALLAVLQQINKAEIVNINSHELIIAYTCMMEYCQNKSWHSLALQYEYKAQQRSLQNTSLQVQDYMSMAHLLCVSLNMRLSIGQITQAIDSGFTANKIIRKLHDNDMRIQMLPVLAEALILANRVSDAVEVLCELEYLDNECDVVVGQTWYYACCLDLLLETGVQLEPFHKCMEFALEYVVDPIFLTDRLPMYFLTSCLAVWYQRKGNEKDFNTWKEKAMTIEPSPTVPSFVYIHSKMKLTESMLIKLAKIKNRAFLKMQQSYEELLKLIKQDFKFYSTVCKKVPVLQIRKGHFKAYYTAVKSSPGKARKLLKNMLKVADGQENVTETQWMEEHLKAWSNKIFETQDYWSSTDIEALDWHAVNSGEQTVLKYILPLPGWFI